VSANLAKNSCELPSGCSSPRTRNLSGFGKHSLLRKCNTEREAVQAIFEGFRSSHSLSKLERRRLGLEAANGRGCEHESEEGSFRRRGESIASTSRVRDCSLLRESRSFDGFLNRRKQVRVAPVCGLENGVAAEVVLEALPTNMRSTDTLPSSGYINSFESHRKTRSSQETHAVAALKESVTVSEELIELSAFRQEHLVEFFEVEGGRRLSGEVKISGAKNSALAVLAGAICSEGQVHLEMIPDLHDISRMFQVLQSVGVKIQRTSCGFLIDAKDLTSVEPCPEAVRKLRASFFVIGSLLGRKGEAVVPLPGGCDIGARPIDLHVRGLEALGAKVHIRQGKVHARALNGRYLTGGSFYLDYPSVGATETLMMAAALADGHTTLSNVAQEPEVVDLANFLISCGACIQGAGTSTLTITGRRKLHGTEYEIIPDRIEAGTFLIAAAITRSAISMSPVVPKHLASVMGKLRSIGCRIQQTRWNSLSISCSELLKSCDVKTLPYPGFPTDLQPQLMSLLTTCSGQSVLEETVFEGRMRHAEELQKLGARMQVSRNVAIISGRDTGSSLYGAPVLATDLRAGAALVLAGMSAEGTTYVEGVGHIDRGYEQLDKKLRLLGASVRRLPHLPTGLTQ